MQPDPELLAEVSEWLQKSDEDLRAATILLTAEPSLAGLALYHCQQAAEKALKAVLVRHGRTFRKTHSIEELGAQAAAEDPGLAPVVADAAPLSMYVWRYRYPGAEGSATPETALQAIQTARAVFEAVRRRCLPDHPP